MIGTPAPDFTLFDTDKKEVSLKDYQGKNLLLLFFPLAFTSVCTTELCTVRDTLTDYNDAQTDVVGVSVDSLFTLEKFKAEQGLNFPLLSDFNAEVSKAYGACYDDFVFGMKNVSKRAAFLIDKEGVVRYAEVLESAGDLPNFTDIQKAMSDLA
ncbi:MAG: redoxin domain-containing protein [Bernardetiaceae bacterium]